MEKNGNIGRPLGKDRSLSKNAILNLALQIIDKDGFKAVSFRVLAKQLYVTPMAITHHVGSRNEMLKSLITQVFTGVGSDPVGDTQSERLRFILVRYCGRVLKHPNLIWCVIAEPESFNSELISLTELIRSNTSNLDGSNNGDTLVNLIVDYTHGFALSVSAAEPSHQLTTEDYLKGLNWILDRA